MVTVDNTKDSDHILEAAIARHMAVDGAFPSLEYILLYPDCTPVINIQGSNVPFTPHNYKEFLKLPYQKLMLYICPMSDYKNGKSHNFVIANICICITLYALSTLALQGS